MSAATNIPGADFVSISLQRKGQPMQTVAATDPLAERTDELQYELREGPCYAAITVERFVLINDMATTVEFPHYGPKAAQLGVGAQAAIQLLHNGINVRLPDRFQSLRGRKLKGTHLLYGRPDS